MDKKPTRRPNKQLAALGPEYMTIAQVAETCRVTPGAVSQWIAAGRILALKVGRHRYPLRASVVEYVGAEASAKLGLGLKQ